MHSEQGRQWNIFVLGLDDFHREQLDRVAGAEEYAFHALSTPDELMLTGVTSRRNSDIPLPMPGQAGTPSYPFEAIASRVFEQLDDFDGNVDGVVGYWDFPTSTMVPVIAERYGLPGPTLDAVLRCEHKYWSRLIQREVAPEMVPAFHAFDPFRDHVRAQIPLAYPFWVKPVKAFSSYLGFRIENDDDLARAVERFRNDIHVIGEPFGRLMEQVDAPAEVQRWGGMSCVAEELVDGRQCTVEGYVSGGEVTAYGVISSSREANGSSFHHFLYPANESPASQARLIDASARIVRAMGLDQSAFNIEFFCDDERDQVWLLEVNPRISQSHTELFALVDGRPNCQAPVKLAVGEDPAMPRGEGPYAVAAKFMYRAFEDAIVRRAPGPCEVERVESLFPGTRVSIEVEQGMQLSTKPGQDSYSFELAVIYTGGHNEAELMRRYEEARELLAFDLEPVGDAVATAR